MRTGRGSWATIPVSSRLGCHGHGYFVTVARRGAYSSWRVGRNDLVPSADLEADLRRVEALGGRVLQTRTPVSAAHWVAVCADPSGTRFVLATTEAPGGPRE